MLEALNSINKHSESGIYVKTTLSSPGPSNKYNRLQTNVNNQNNISEEEIQKFTPFILNKITSDSNHRGYIQSCVRGTKKIICYFLTSVVNIDFVQKKNNHHQHNSVSILIDINRLTYTIRCKDPHCNNTLLEWSSIQ